MPTDSESTLTQKQRYWLNHLKAAGISGLSLSAYARQEQIPTKRLYTWKTQLIKRGLLPCEKQPAFAKLTLSRSDLPTDVRSVSSNKSAVTSVTLPNGITLKFESLSQESLMWIANL